MTSQLLCLLADRALTMESFQSQPSIAHAHLVHCLQLSLVLELGLGGRSILTAEAGSSSVGAVAVGEPNPSL